VLEWGNANNLGSGLEFLGLFSPLSTTNATQGSVFGFD
jgi:hypothetical protein